MASDLKICRKIILHNENTTNPTRSGRARRLQKQHGQGSSCPLNNPWLRSYAGRFWQLLAGSSSRARKESISNGANLHESCVRCAILQRHGRNAWRLDAEGNREHQDEVTAGLDSARRSPSPWACGGPKGRRGPAPIAQGPSLL